MKNLVVTVNGVAYNAQVEETGAAAPAAPVTAPAPVVASVPAAAASVPVSATTSAPASVPVPTAPKVAKPAVGTNSVNAPIPDTILNVLISAGDSVKKGQTLTTLGITEMGNETMAAQDDVIAGVHVSEGDAVNSGGAPIFFQ